MSILLWALLASGCSSKTPAPALRHPDHCPITQRLERLEAAQGMILRRLDSFDHKTEPSLLSSSPPHWNHTPNLNQSYNIETQDAHRKGPENALVTVVIWSNFACPFCKLASGIMRELEQVYPNDLRFVFKHNPLSSRYNHAGDAAIAAEAAGQQGRFWEMHDLLFANSDRLTEPNFLLWAQALQLNLHRFKQDLKDPAIQARVNHHRSQARALGAVGTPSFFINGRYIPGVLPLRRYALIVDRAILSAKHLQDQDIPQ